MLLFLILGAIVNVAVAWGYSGIMSYWCPVIGVFDTANHEQRAWWVKNAPSEAGLIAEGLSECWNRGAKVDWLYSFDESPTTVYAKRAMAGWPAFALQGSCWMTNGGKRVANRNAMMVGERVIPALPIWPGFAINAIFYAVVLWMLVAGPRSLNRKRRRMRGLCANCAYDLRGTPSGVCPECGEPVEPAAPPRSS